ncbi:hypothetical protein Syun_028020 [Stephania yunnanensis]|uniref:DUF641 domain-containing protein n=1 Tax=Stephania yunnanensis TaxID=152371 RepID=A0AAP0EGZ7_9MAGN
MDSVKPVPGTHNVGAVVRSFTKALRLRTGRGVTPDDTIRKTKLQDRFKSDNFHSADKDEENAHYRMGVEVLLAKLFASIASVKAAYAELQIAQSPYDAEGIQSADEAAVGELKRLSELKYSYLKKQFDPCPEEGLLSAEILEQQSVIRTYEIMAKKLESQQKLKDSEIEFLREKLAELDKQNEMLDKRLSHDSPLSSVLDDVHLSGLSHNHFNRVLCRVVKSVQCFVKLMMGEMESTGWDLGVAASAIEPNVVYPKPKHLCFSFESFVCRVMFDGFQYPNFLLGNEPMQEKKQRQLSFFNVFQDFKHLKPMEFLVRNPNSTFGRFCCTKYLHLVHPKLETSFFGDLKQRNLVNSGGCPDSSFFCAFLEMAKQVWLLHCAAFSFDPEASIFQIKKGCRFSEVFMEAVNHEAFFSSENKVITSPKIAFTVVPGFKIGKSVLQSQVYLSQ